MYISETNSKGLICSIASSDIEAYLASTKDKDKRIRIPILIFVVIG